MHEKRFLRISSLKSRLQVEIILRCLLCLRQIFIFILVQEIGAHILKSVFKNIRPDNFLQNLVYMITSWENEVSWISISLIFVERVKSSTHVQIAIELASHDIVVFSSLCYCGKGTKILINDGEGVRHSNYISNENVLCSYKFQFTLTCFVSNTVEGWIRLNNPTLEWWKILWIH